MSWQTWIANSTGPRRELADINGMCMLKEGGSYKAIWGSYVTCSGRGPMWPVNLRWLLDNNLRVEDELADCRR